MRFVESATAAVLEAVLFHVLQTDPNKRCESKVVEMIPREEKATPVASRVA
jgi:hypothetical protein